MSKKALGKGIGALFKDINVNQPDTSGENISGKDVIITVPVDNVRANPDQPRKDFPEKSLQELADSIKEKGVIQPLIVNKDKDNVYSIIAGERRYRASRKAGLKEIPVIVREYSKEEKLEIALIENIQREDLSPLEEAMAYKHLMEILELNQEDIAKRVGKNRSTVANSLRLLKLPEFMHPALHDGRMSPGHARAILSVNNNTDRQKLYNKVVNEQISVREAEAAASLLNNREIQGKKNKKEVHLQRDPNLMEIEQRLIDNLGTKVKIIGDLKNGKIEISYYSMDDLDRVISIFK